MENILLLAQWIGWDAVSPLVIIVGGPTGLVGCVGSGFEEAGLASSQTVKLWPPLVVMMGTSGLAGALLRLVRRE
jgi:hypothetical protein